MLTHAQKSRSWIKRTLRLGETTPPRPGSCESDAEQDALRKLKTESKKAHKNKEAKRVFGNQGQDTTGQVDKKGKPTGPKFEEAAPRADRNTAPRRPRAEPITSHWTAGLGVGGPGAGSTPLIGHQPAGRGGHPRETDPSGINKAQQGAPKSSSRGYHTTSDSSKRVKKKNPPIAPSGLETSRASNDNTDHLARLTTP